MKGVPEGIRIDGRVVPWGTRLDDAARAFGGSLARHGRSATVRCADAYGFPALYAELSAPAEDRPVTTVHFALAPQRGEMDTAFWTARLRDLLGPPEQDDSREVPSGADPADSVTRYLRWSGPEFTISLSLYGALRKGEGGPSPGSLWIVWSTEAAARPYLEEWKARCERLAEIASTLSALHTYRYDDPAGALFAPPPEDDAPDALERALRSREATLSLSHPDILRTPPAITARLTDHTFCLWSSEGHGVWGASTRFDTVAFPIGSRVEVLSVELLPAKGGGYHMLMIGDWYVRTWDRRSSIEAAASEIARIPGVKVEYQQGYDC